MEYNQQDYYFLSKPHIVFISPSHEKRPVTFQDIETKEKSFMSTKDFSEIMSCYNGLKQYAEIIQGEVKLLFLEGDKLVCKEVHQQKKLEKSYSFKDLIKTGRKNKK